MSVTLPNGISNGRPQQRKQLSDQLDRFDTILDGLADGLNEAICDAAKEGTRAAVKDAIIEILTNPDLRALIARPPEAVSPKPSIWQKLKARVARAKAAVIETATPVVRAVTRRAKKVTDPVIGVGRALAGVWQWKKAMLIGLGVGLVTTAVCLTASHGFAAVVSGVASAVTAVAIQLGMWVKKTALKLRMV